jgi:hypothetical protein
MSRRCPHYHAGRGHGDHGVGAPRRAAQPCRLGHAIHRAGPARPGVHGLSVCRLSGLPTREAKVLGRIRSPILFTGFKYSRIDLNTEIVPKFWKSIEIHRNVQKFQSKFDMNHQE